MSWIVLFILNKVYQTPFLLCIYKLYKYALHYITQTSELYRLCHAASLATTIDMTTVPAFTVHRIEQSIVHSSQLLQEKQRLGSSHTLEDILQKKFPPFALKSPAASILGSSLNRIVATRQLAQSVREKVDTKYDSDNKEHEDKLYELWNCMMPDTKLEARLSKQWVDVRKRLMTYDVVCLISSKQIDWIPGQ
jgi:hypothetical protein